MSNSPFEKLCKEPRHFNFFQGVRLFLKSADYVARAQVSKEEYQKIRENDQYLQDLRFKVDTKLHFPASPIHKISVFLNSLGDKKFLHSRMHVTFMGLTGAFGALPDYYSEMVLQRIHLKDNTLKDFLDIFNHRSISLFYKAWVKNKFYVSYETNHALRGTEDRFSDVLRSVQGNGTLKLQNRLRVSDEVLLHYVGVFAQQPRSAVLLEQLINDYFSLSVKVLQFQSQCIRLNPSEYTKIGDKKNSYNQLNVNAVLGEKVWDVMGKFRIYIHSLSYAEFYSLLPEKNYMLTLQELVRYYVGPQLNFDFQLDLKKGEVPFSQLCKGNPLYLGWNVWLKSEEITEDRDDAIFDATI